MSALAAVTSGRGWEDAGRGGQGAGRVREAARPAQPRLFALPGGAVEDAVLAPPEVAPVPERVAVVAAPVRTLDEALNLAWGAVASGTTAECPVCAGPLRPRWSAGAGVVGGRCADCGTGLE
jgi:hypothetical protein